MHKFIHERYLPKVIGMRVNGTTARSIGQAVSVLQELAGNEAYYYDATKAYGPNPPQMAPVKYLAKIALRINGETGYAGRFIRYIGSPHTPLFDEPHIDAPTHSGHDSPHAVFPPSQEAWLANANINTESTFLRYSTVEPERKAMRNEQGLWIAGSIPENHMEEVEIPPFDGSMLHLVMFCASKVPHMGVYLGRSQALASYMKVI